MALVALSSAPARAEDVSAAPAPAAEAADCPGAWPAPPPRLQPLGRGVWLIPGAGGDATAANRGQVANLVAVADGGRTWLVGSGPSPAFGHALACTLANAGRPPVTDIVAPWAHPELVLGHGGFAGARLWAHADVAAAMTRQCAQCVQRLDERLGAARVDLGPDPVRVPDRLLRGSAGRLGPWAWWRWPRAEGIAVTVWWHASGSVLHAPGLLWVGRPPDLRDADIETMTRAVSALRALARRLGAATRLRVTGEQGTVGSAADVAAAEAYLRALQRSVEAAQRQGAAETDPPAPLPGVSAAWQAHPQHALNWQRAWRQAEARSLGPGR